MKIGEGICFKICDDGFVGGWYICFGVLLGLSFSGILWEWG